MSCSHAPGASKVEDADCYTACHVEDSVLPTVGCQEVPVLRRMQHSFHTPGGPCSDEPPSRAGTWKGVSCPDFRYSVVI